MRRLAGGWVLAAACAAGWGGAWGQEAAKPKQTVLYVAEPQTVSAGKLAMVEVHFKVLDGYHVNSHLPKSEFLIPTELKAVPVAAVTVGAPQYPAGREFSFSFSPEETLDVYSGNFTIKLPVTAAAGEHTVEAALHYQACDKAACYPPKTLPVQIPVTAK